uniref:Essential protein Yae1 N-terminal domain-containing protein n=1 Tax=Culex tarsalis TaxID=7177 RepID=A0A1Q3FIZ3_CULTA
MTKEPSTAHHSASNATATDDVDINDVFDQLLLAEERLAEDSYRRGLAQGVREGNVDAYHFGYHRGAEVGAELGFYYGVICGQEKALQESGGSSKGESLLKELKREIEEFPRFNDLEADIVEGLVRMRTKYKKLCALLKISAKYVRPNELSF